MHTASFFIALALFGSSKETKDLRVQVEAQQVTIAELRARLETSHAQTATANMQTATANERTAIANHAAGTADSKAINAGNHASAAASSRAAVLAEDRFNTAEAGRNDLITASQDNADLLRCLQENSAKLTQLTVIVACFLLIELALLVLILRRQR